MSTFHQKPLRRTWRGNKEGTIELESMGFAEGVSGHITVRDPVLPDHYWMNPFAEHFSTMTKSMLVLVDPSGHVSPHGAQLPINTAGFHIHSAIHKARPDIHAAAHCHSIHGKAWSAFGRPIDTLTQDSCLFYDNLGVYANFGGIVLAQEEGENIAKALGPKMKTCILGNHGLLTLGRTVDEAVYLFAALERQCHVQLMAEAAAANGIPKTIISPEDAEFTAKTIQWWENTYVNFQPEYKLLLKETKGDFLL
ncbi:arad-like aldolase/epimerase [Hymenopellis radicata]|nr:arad-like aldolase/epimerase [Hymenopellis radicata]